jgi:hypothetical protein
VRRAVNRHDRAVAKQMLIAALEELQQRHQSGEHAGRGAKVRRMIDSDTSFLWSVESTRMRRDLGILTDRERVGSRTPRDAAVWRTLLSHGPQ